MMRQHFLLSFTENRSLFHQNLVFIGHMIIIINVLYYQSPQMGVLKALLGRVIFLRY